MGIAKNTLGYGICHLYHPDPQTFIARLAEALEADFAVRELLYTGLDDPDLHLAESSTRFGKPQRYDILIDWDWWKDYKGQEPREPPQPPDYELTFAGHLPDSDSVSITFYPNGSFRLHFVDFEGVWYWFLYTLKYDAFSPERQQKLADYQQVRAHYWAFLRRLGVQNLIIFCDAYHKLEDMGDWPSPATWAQILHVAREVDKLTLYSLPNVLMGERLKPSLYDIMEKDFRGMDVGFLDHPDPS